MFNFFCIFTIRNHLFKRKSFLSTVPVFVPDIIDNISLRHILLTDKTVLSGFYLIKFKLYFDLPFCLSTMYRYSINENSPLIKTIQIHLHFEYW